MPVLGALIKALFGNLSGLLLAVMSTRIGVALAAVATLAALYVVAVGAFSAVVQPALGALFTTQYGQVLGLAFPPIAGTIVTGYCALWLGLVTYRYWHRFVALLVPR